MKNSPPKTPVSNWSDLLSKTDEPNEERNDLAYLVEYEEAAMEYLKNDGAYMGISTGYPAVDSLMGSFLPRELFTIGGDTGHGKSLLGMNIAQNAYAETGQPVLLVNLELTRNQAVQRFYNLSGKDHDYAGILIQKATAVNYKDIDILMMRAKQEGACLVVIDHLHFFNDSIADNAASALTRIVKHFKECAVEMDLPVILLSHVTPTTKADGSTARPDLHGFKGSRSIEQLSDMVGFVFRDDKNPKEVQFYMKKNRSRPLVPDTVILKQKEWKLVDESWHDLKNSPPVGILPGLEDH